METAVIDAPVGVLKDADGPVWVEALPARVYQTPFYGEVPVTLDKLQKFVSNFKSGVRGQEIATDFEHGMDQAKGKKASGWYRDFEIRPSSSDPTQFSLYALVDFTEEAKKEIIDKQWKYFSLEWDDKYKAHDGNEYEDVVIGGALTNRPVAKQTLPINFSEAMWKELNEEERKYFAVRAIDRMTGESKEWEHSEPGTGTPPTPRTDEDGSDDIAIKEGWRRESGPGADEPPEAKKKEKGGGNKEMEYVFAENDARELFHELGLDSKAKPEDVLTELKKRFGELAELKARRDATEQEKEFAERYPQYWEEHRTLMERDRDHSATVFSESISKVRKAEGYGLKDTREGLSTLAKEKVEEVHKKFSEGTVKIGDFEDCVKAIMNGGIVTFGEIGSGKDADDLPEIDTSSATGVAQARKLFSEVMQKVQRENPDKDSHWALAEAAKKHPDLYEAYKIALPA